MKPNKARRGARNKVSRKKLSIKKPLEQGGQRVGKIRPWLLKPYFICTRMATNVPFRKVMGASARRGSPRQSQSGAYAAIWWRWEKGKRYMAGK